MKKFLLLILLIIAGYFFHPFLLGKSGRFLVVDEAPAKSDSVLVLNSGLEYHPRLIQAASLFNERWAESIIINGNRKTDVFPGSPSDSFSDGNQGLSLLEVGFLRLRGDSGSVSGTW